MPNREDIEKDTKQEKYPPPRWRASIILAGVMVFVMGFWWIVARQGQNPTLLNHKITARQNYLDILGEPHTGLRLARLKDFIAHTPLNTDTTRARTGRDALDINEQNAWARLTDMLYDIDKTQDEKKRAVAHYKANWGVWNRQAVLPKLLAATGLGKAQTMVFTAPQNAVETDGQILANYNPRNRSSKYTKGSAEAVLAGDAFTRVVYPYPATLAANIQTLEAKHTRPVRIKFAKRPRYPRRAFRRGISGQITLALDINERGHVVRTTVISAQAPRYKDKFIRAARRAAMASKFHPKTEAGQAVATSRYLRKYSFTAGG